MDKTIEIRSNGFEIRYKNRRVKVIERTPDKEGLDKDVSGYIIELKRFVGDADTKPACNYDLKRGIATTAVALSREVLSDIFLGLAEFYKNQNK